MSRTTKKHYVHEDRAARVERRRIIEVEFVDYGDEYDMFGKVVARSDVSAMTDVERVAEILDMKALLGSHVVAREVELVGAVA